MLSAVYAQYKNDAKWSEESGWAPCKTCYELLLHNC
ncbi:hypothetical protein T4A_1370 [Trichinella pseudospiralis]|uniref:Uncharacterized protein n=1 Tax=Trichinella pseudospiralis TaxID=6337 RepID=A0A0V1CKT1_TRIPS|nr:hypothetical protein T4A_1370 [Trichinella pseudospiralis]